MIDFVVYSKSEELKALKLALVKCDQSHVRMTHGKLRIEVIHSP